MNFLRRLFKTIAGRITNGFLRMGSNGFGIISDKTFKVVFEEFFMKHGYSTPEDYNVPRHSAPANDFTLSRNTANDFVDLGDGRKYVVRGGGGRQPYIRKRPRIEDEPWLPYDAGKRITIEIKTSNFGDGPIRYGNVEDGIRKLKRVIHEYMAIIMVFPLNSMEADVGNLLERFSKESGIPVYVCACESENWENITEAMKRSGIDFARIINDVVARGKCEEAVEVSIAA